MRSAMVSRRALSRSLALICVAVLVVATLIVQVGSAQESGKVIVLGESLSDAERNDILQYFDAGPDDTVLTISVAETNQIMEGVLNNLGGYDGVYSSSALTCKSLGEGLDVTTRNITQVTPSMYAMALVTAGIGDAKLVVSGPSGTAFGISAMAGVIKTLEIAPCESGENSKSRQALAIEQLSLTAQIGLAISKNGTDGLQPASDVILETQKTIVTDRLTKKAEIDAALAEEEQARNVSFPSDLRGQLVDLFVRLTKANIDWSTFSAGWEIDFNGSSLTMRGDGVAIRNAQLTATAENGGALTATAEAARATDAAMAAMTATAQAESIAQTATADARNARRTATVEARSAKLTATAEAQSARLTATAAARATRDASEALTATAAAQPTMTVAPMPSPTPEPYELSGTVDDVSGELVSLKERGKDEPTVLTVDPDATITRDDQPATLGDVQKGDKAEITVDGATGHIRILAASTPAVSFVTRIAGLWWLIPLGIMIPLVLKVKNRTTVEPFVVKRVTPA